MKRNDTKRADQCQDAPTGRSGHLGAIVTAGGHRRSNRIRSPHQAGSIRRPYRARKPFPRHLGGAWRLLLCAPLVAALGPVAQVRSAPPAGGFTDLGALGLPAIEQGSLVWGDYDNDGELDVLLEGSTGSELVAGIYRNDGGTSTKAAAGLARNLAATFGAHRGQLD